MDIFTYLYHTQQDAKNVNGYLHSVDINAWKTPINLISEGNSFVAGNARNILGKGSKISNEN